MQLPFPLGVGGCQVWRRIEHCTASSSFESRMSSINVSVSDISLLPCIITFLAGVSRRRVYRGDASNAFLWSLPLATDRCYATMSLRIRPSSVGPINRCLRP